MEQLKLRSIIATMFISTTILSCSKEFREPQPALTSAATVSLANTASISHPGRTLAANCFQCHGTDGFAGELKIASMSAGSIVLKMNGFAVKDPKADIMNFHAQAFTSDEINLIADYFSKQN